MEGKRLKELLEQKGIKQIDAAKALGITSQAMYHMFANKDIKTGVLETLCKAFDIDMNYFFPEFCVSSEQHESTESFYRALCEVKDRRVKELEAEIAKLQLEQAKIG